MLVQRRQIELKLLVLLSNLMQPLAVTLNFRVRHVILTLTEQPFFLSDFPLNVFDFAVRKPAFSPVATGGCGRA